jgi:hypothetical protein
MTHGAIRPWVEPTSMVDEAIAEKASDVAKCKCVATAP